MSKLLDGRLFSIPEYQRAYSWTSQQRADLFGDLRKVYRNGSDDGHFMAAIVCLRRGKQSLGTDEFDKLDIVDGQQRLTTLIILLNAIKYSLDSANSKESKAAEEIANLLVKVDGDELLLLQTNHDSSHHFANYLRNGTAPASQESKTLADRELLRAIEESQEFVNEWKDGAGRLPELLALLKNRLFFLLHEISNEKTVYTVFEVLNSRGLAVSWLDRLKSIMMGAAFELQNANNTSLIAELHTTWRDIFLVIGLRPKLDEEALRFAATLETEEPPSRPLGEKEAVDELRREATSAKNIRATASWLLRVTKACDQIHSNRRLNAVTEIQQARLLAVAILLRDDITDKQRSALLVRWEKVTFRIYGMIRRDSRTRVGDYVRLAWRIRNEQLSVQAINAEIGEIGKDFPIESAVSALRSSNCYEGWETELRYFMYRFEEHLARKNNLNFRNEQWEKIWELSPSTSIEHIWAKSSAPKSSKHRLGNLVILPPKLNSKLQADRPEEKVEQYRKTGLLIAGEVADWIENKEKWNGKTIAEREDVLLEWANVEWSD